MDRRRFLGVGAAGALGLLHATRSDAAQARGPQDPIPYGVSKLGLEDDRDGTLYVPKSYKDGTPMPLLMMLHGFGGTGEGVRYTYPLAEEFGVIIVGPESRGLTWGVDIPGFDADVHYLAAAYKQATVILDIDPDHVALGGQSDGAGYALGMGLAYGDIFNHLMIFSGGLMQPYRRKGKPKIFLAHGIDDHQMPIDRTARLYVPQLKSDGYDVTYKEYEGGHGTPLPVVREAFEWFLADKKK